MKVVWIKWEGSCQVSAPRADVALVTHSPLLLNSKSLLRPSQTPLWPEQGWPRTGQTREGDVRIDLIQSGSPSSQSVPTQPPQRLNTSRALSHVEGDVRSGETGITVEALWKLQTEKKKFRQR